MVPATVIVFTQVRLEGCTFGSNTPREQYSNFTFPTLLADNRCPAVSTGVFYSDSATQQVRFSPGGVLRQTVFGAGFNPGSMWAPHDLLCCVGCLTVQTTGHTGRTRTPLY
jgi:hypothetical protein